MNSGRTVFAQLIEHLLHKESQKCVARYWGDGYAKNAELVVRCQFQEPTLAGADFKLFR